MPAFIARQPRSPASTFGTVTSLPGQGKNTYDHFHRAIATAARPLLPLAARGANLTARWLKSSGQRKPNSTRAEGLSCSSCTFSSPKL